MLSDLAIWYLRKTKKSVLIGYEIEGGYVRAMNQKSRVYDNKLTDIDYRTPDDEPFLIPDGEFSVTKLNR